MSTKIKGILVTDAQSDVYTVLKSYGTLSDSALVPLAQHMLDVNQTSSGIRTRRKELVDKGLVNAIGKVRTGTGRSATTWKAR